MYSELKQIKWIVVNYNRGIIVLNVFLVLCTLFNILTFRVTNTAKKFVLSKVSKSIK